MREDKRKKKDWGMGKTCVKKKVNNSLREYTLIISEKDTMVRDCKRIELLKN
jgi:hypothetical protein